VPLLFLIICGPLAEAQIAPAAVTNDSIRVIWVHQFQYENAPERDFLIMEGDEILSDNLERACRKMLQAKGVTILTKSRRHWTKAFSADVSAQLTDTIQMSDSIKNIDFMLQTLYRRSLGEQRYSVKTTIIRPTGTKAHRSTSTVEFPPHRIDYELSEESKRIIREDAFKPLVEELATYFYQYYHVNREWSVLVKAVKVDFSTPCIDALVNFPHLLLMTLSANTRSEVQEVTSEDDANALLEVKLAQMPPTVYVTASIRRYGSDESVTEMTHFQDSQKDSCSAAINALVQRFQERFAAGVK
jgi:hypothetical protein